jgi:hypothetical protein
MRSRLLTSLIAAVIVLRAARAQAEQPQPQTLPQYPQPTGPGTYSPSGYVPAPPSGHHRHDGTYVRLQIGAGFTTFAGIDLSSGIIADVSGPSINLNVAVGGAVAENLILYGELFFVDAEQPDVKLVKLNTYNAGHLNGSVDVIGLGGGVAYYFATLNFYLAGTLATAKIESNDSNSNTIGSTNWGIGLSGLVGKEWWASPQWGLGVAGQLIVAVMKDRGGANAPTWDARSFGLLFSATYN